MTERITDPKAIDASQIAGILATGKTATIQFSKPLQDKALLPKVNSICAEYGDKVEVRFFGYYSEVFDAESLTQIPDVRWLSIDCLTSISSIEPIYGLARLSKLSLGIYELDIPDVLCRIQIQEIRELSICETRKGNIDLSPLRKCTHLSRLYLASHCEGFSILKELGSLTELSLRSISKKQSMEVVASIPKLSKLEMILGGRPDINELNHPTLHELEIRRVLGFSSVGDLSRFPALQKLRIEDQIKLESLDFNKPLPELQELVLFNCKKLERLGPLEHLVSLKRLVVSKTALDFDALLALPLPPSLRTASLRTGKAKVDAPFRATLDSLGYPEFTPRPKAS